MTTRDDIVNKITAKQLEAKHISNECIELQKELVKIGHPWKRGDIISFRGYHPNRKYVFLNIIVQVSLYNIHPNVQYFVVGLKKNNTLGEVVSIETVNNYGITKHGVYADPKEVERQVLENAPFIESSPRLYERFFGN